MVMVALATASRVGELRNLEWRDLDLEEGRLLLGRRPGQQSRLETNNRQARATWISGEALRLLKEDAKAQNAANDVKDLLAGLSEKVGGAAEKGKNS